MTDNWRPASPIPSEPLAESRLTLRAFRFRLFGTPPRRAVFLRGLSSYGWANCWSWTWISIQIPVEIKTCPVEAGREGAIVLERGPFGPLLFMNWVFHDIIFENPNNLLLITWPSHSVSWELHDLRCYEILETKSKENDIHMKHIFVRKWLWNNFASPFSELVTIAKCQFLVFTFYKSKKLNKL